MRLLSVNVGRPRRVEWNGHAVTTSIFKSPVTGPVRVTATDVDGDEQADPSVHGAPAKTVYAYPVEHYPYWRRALGVSDLPLGSFGENLSVEGIEESDVRPGDRLRIADAELEVTQPRFPCFKLTFRFERADMVRRFGESGFSGFYLRVAEEGTITAGDGIRRGRRGPNGPTISEIFATRIAREAAVDG